MTTITTSIIFALVSASFLQASAYFFQLLQTKFRNIMVKQLKHSTLFTLIRILSYSSGYAFIISFIVGIVSVFMMIKYSVLNEGFVIIIPFIIFFVILVLFSFLIEKKLKEIRNQDFGISNNPIISFSIENSSKNNKLKTKNEDFNEEIQNIEDCFIAINTLLNLNLINPYAKCKTHFATPGPKYPSGYLWDSAFISGVWRIWDVNIAKEIMMPFLDNQLANGHCPQTVLLGMFINSKITNPPLIAWSLVEIARMTGDYSFFTPIYENLKKFTEFLYKERSKEGLFVWKHSYESGIDNSPRFTDASEKIKFEIGNIWAVDFNTWMVLHNDRMAEIAEKLGKDSDVSIYRKKRDELIELINKYLWDPTLGLYFDYNFKEKELIKIPTIFSLFPMFGNVPDTEKARRLIENIKNPELFNTIFPFPTVAKNEASFMKDCWRGSVWINTSYVVIKALELYGEEEFASEMAYKIVKGVANTYINEGSIYEFYDPDNYTLTELTRKKGNLMKQITLGGKPVNKFVGWTGLANTLLIEDVIGYQRLNGETEFHPHLPKEFINVKISLDVDQFSEKLEIVMDEENIINGSIFSLDKKGEIVNTTKISLRNHSK